jgi:predicted metal-dependent hydrolase
MPVSQHDQKIPLALARRQGCSDGPLHPQALVGLELFNRGEFFEAHEALELAWREETGVVRDLYRGILQVAVMYHHVARNNFRGAMKMYQRCMTWLTPFPPVCRGIDISDLRQNCQAVFDELSRLGPHGINRFNRAFLRPVKYTMQPSMPTHDLNKQNDSPDD